MVLNSCSFSSKDLTQRDANLYSTPGFEGDRPIEGALSRLDVARPGDYRVVPDYYYRSPPPQAVVPQQRQQQASPYQPASGVYPAASRFYTNPYALKPPAQYPYYDSDQYYTPPRGQGYDSYQDQVGPTQQY